MGERGADGEMLELVVARSALVALVLTVLVSVVKSL